MSTHTPGPWHICEPPDENEIKALDSGNCLVRRALAYGGTEAEIEANARLIAAAPELLEACKLLVYRVECQADGDQIGPEDIAEANAAIAKAEGRLVDDPCEGRTIWNSDGTDGPCLICPPPA